MPRRYKLPLGLGKCIPAEQWMVEAWTVEGGGGKGRLQHQPGGSRQRWEKWTGRSARRIHGAGREGGSLAGQLGQGTGIVGQLWVGEGEEKHRPLRPVCTCVILTTPGDLCFLVQAAEAQTAESCTQGHAARK